VGQCRGTTKKGDRCRREAVSGSDYCSIHEEMESREGGDRWDEDFSDAAKTVLGIAIAAVIIISYLVRGR
jgi:hypothetical protein